MLATFQIAAWAAGGLYSTSYQGRDSFKVEVFFASHISSWIHFRSCPTVVPALRPKPSPFDFQRPQFIEAVMRKSYIVKDVFPFFVKVFGFRAAFANNDLNYQARNVEIK